MKSLHFLRFVLRCSQLSICTQLICGWRSKRAATSYFHPFVYTLHVILAYGSTPVITERPDHCDLLFTLKSKINELCLSFLDDATEQFHCQSQTIKEKFTTLPVLRRREFEAKRKLQADPENQTCSSVTMEEILAPLRQAVREQVRLFSIRFQMQPEPSERWC